MSASILTCIQRLTGKWFLIILKSTTRVYQPFNGAETMLALKIIGFISTSVVYSNPRIPTIRECKIINLKLCVHKSLNISYCTALSIFILKLNYNPYIYHLVKPILLLRNMQLIIVYKSYQAHKSHEKIFLILLF
jgi:hypothetical protein